MQQPGEIKTPKHKVIWTVDADHQYVLVLPGNYDGTNWRALIKEGKIPLVCIKNCPVLQLTDLIL
jgi:hypothetical protein